MEMYLKYANEFALSMPVISSSCRTYYVQNVVKLQKKTGIPLSEEQSKILREQLQKVESSQKLEGISTEKRKKIVENFLTCACLPLDEQEAKPELITKKLAVAMYTAASLISLLTIFGELSPEWERKQKGYRIKSQLILKGLEKKKELSSELLYISVEKNLAKIAEKPIGIIPEVKKISTEEDSPKKQLKTEEINEVDIPAFETPELFFFPLNSSHKQLLSTVSSMIMKSPEMKITRENPKFSQMIENASALLQKALSQIKAEQKHSAEESLKQSLVLLENLKENF